MRIKSGWAINSTIPIISVSISLKNKISSGIELSFWLDSPTIIPVPSSKPRDFIFFIQFILVLYSEFGWRILYEFWPLLSILIKNLTQLASLYNF